MSTFSYVSKVPHVGHPVKGFYLPNKTQTKEKVQELKERVDVMCLDLSRTSAGAGGERELGGGRALSKTMPPCTQNPPW